MTTITGIDIHDQRMLARFEKAGREMLTAIHIGLGSRPDLRKGGDRRHSAPTRDGKDCRSGIDRRFPKQQHIKG